MSAGIRSYLWTRRPGARLALLGLLLGGLAGCAPLRTPTVDLATPTVLSMPSPSAPLEATQPSGWTTYVSQGQCGYAISHPADLQAAIQSTYSWILNPSQTEPGGPARNFIYVSTIPDGFQGEAGEIYNYDPAEAETLFNMQVGESQSLRDDPNIAQAFTYTRRPDATLSDQAAPTYENTQPWEFPIGTKEIRHYLKGNGCTYLIGGYLDTTGSAPSGAITQERFDQIIATFRMKS